MVKKIREYSSRGASAKIGGILFASAMLLGPAANVSAAGFSMNFSSVKATAPAQYDQGSTVFEGTCPAGSVGSCAGNDGTKFLQEMVNVDGTNYAHNVIGDPSSGFAYEYYTRISSVGSLSCQSGTCPAPMGFSPDYGGMEQDDPINHYGASAGCYDSGNSTGWSGVCGSGLDPLNVNHDYNFSGTGTGDGSKMVMRMVVDQGDGMSLEIYKPRPENKMLVSQTILDGVVRSEFSTDMRGLSYTDMSTAAPVVNRQVVDDPNLPVPGAADFDMSMAQEAHITSGRFIYTPGAGWNTSNGWDDPSSVFDEGVYTYAESGFDVLHADWASFFNPADNASACNGAVGNNRNATDACPP